MALKRHNGGAGGERQCEYAMGLDLVRNDVQRRANESKRKKYDSADSMESAEKAIAFTSGEGDANNTFFASAGAIGGAAKRQKIN